MMALRRRSGKRSAERSSILDSTSRDSKLDVGIEGFDGIWRIGCRDGVGGLEDAIGCGGWNGIDGRAKLNASEGSEAPAGTGGRGVVVVVVVVEVVVVLVVGAWVEGLCGLNGKEGLAKLKASAGLRSLSTLLWTVVVLAVVIVSS